MEAYSIPPNENNLSQITDKYCIWKNEPLPSFRYKQIEHMKKILILAVLFSSVLINSVAQVNGDIKGKIVDSAKNPLMLVSVAAYVNSTLVAQSETDEKGYFSMKSLPSGNYDLKAYLMGYNQLVINNVVVNTDKLTFLNLDLKEIAIDIPDIDVIHYRVPLIEKTGSGQVIQTADIEHMPYTAVADIAATTTGAFQSDTGEDINIRGSRSESTQYIIDGIKVFGAVRIPKNAIKEVKVITGGVPAMFGDATGGIIMITTKSFGMW